MDTTDQALNRLGKWGRWQILLYIFISLATTWPGCWHMLAIVFLGGIPKHHCVVPHNVTPSDVIPKDKGGGLASCSIAENISQILSGEISRNDANTTSCTNGYHYYGDVGKTIVSQWDLVCGSGYLVETSQTVMVVGVIFGAMLFSFLSDKYGRKPVYLFSQCAMVVVGVATAFCYNLYAFMVLRFCAGALQQGIVLTGFILACELFPASMRTFAGMAIEDFWACGMCVFAFFAYLIRNWMHLQLLISILGILAIPLFWFLPESIPWLIANGKIEEAEKILKNAARFNNVSMPEKVLSPGKRETENTLKNHDDGSKDAEKMLYSNATDGGADKTDAQDSASYTLLDVFKHRILLINAAIMCLLWLVNSLVYFGLSLSTSSLAGDRYLNFFLSGLVEIPAYTLCIFVLQRFGRRWPLVIFHIIAGVALGITMFIPEKSADGTNLLPLLITLNMIGKFGITGSFGVVFLYAPEIFPTTLRAQMMGICSVGGRIGNVVAPFTSLVARELPWLPGILFGSLSIIVGIMALKLPDTLNRPLPQTVEDIKNWTKKPKRVKDEGNHISNLEMTNIKQDSY